LHLQHAGIPRAVLETFALEGLGSANWCTVHRLLWAIALVLAGCGRPATQQECDEIVGRIAELEIREAASAAPAEVEKQVHETKEAFQQKSKRECVGKRITQRALGCVRSAKTAEEIVKVCLN
jgi:hypothetical protein